MRSTVDIIVAAKEHQPVTDDELRLALLVVSSINRLVSDELRSLAEAVMGNMASGQLRAQFALETLDRMFYAKKKDPAEWLGTQNIPGNPEHDKRLEAAKGFYEKATGDKL